MPAFILPQKSFAGYGDIKEGVRRSYDLRFSVEISKVRL